MSTPLGYSKCKTLKAKYLWKASPWGEFLYFPNFFSWVQSKAAVPTESIREAPSSDKCFSNRLLPNSFSTPPPHANGPAFGQTSFVKSESILYNSVFWYFDNDNGQTLLRFLVQQNTALFSTFLRSFVRPSVRHGRDISTFLDNLIV